jgi:hypothetical protein
MGRQDPAPAPASDRADKEDRAALVETADRGDRLGRASYDLPPFGQFLIVNIATRITALLGSVLGTSLAMPRASLPPALAPLRAHWLAFAASFAFNLRSFRSMIERN